MNRSEIRSWMRHVFSRYGWALVLYNWLTSIAVTCVCAVDASLRILPELSGGDWNLAFAKFMPALETAMMTNAWGYIVAMVIGAGLMFQWKGEGFCLRTIWKWEREMSVSDFLQLLVLLVSGQAFFQVIAIVFEFVLSLIGLSAFQSVESATGVENTFSMILYTAIFAPVGEEILFRGLLLRGFVPFGKKFAVFASACLFGLFHGNLVQTPYAFAVGLVLGYTAVNYSLVWSIALHMFNNLVLGIVLPEVLGLWPEPFGSLVFVLLIWGCAVAAAVILLSGKESIREYRREGKIHPWPMQCLFTNSGVVIFSVLALIDMLLRLTPH